MSPVIGLQRFKTRRKCVTPAIAVVAVAFFVFIGAVQVKYDTIQNELFLSGQTKAKAQVPLRLDAPSVGNSINGLDPYGNGNGKADNHHRILQEDVSSNRPFMYTYYEPATTDMTEDADQDLLENWKKAWYDAGWQPMILNEADARKVPEYDALVELVIDTKHIGSYNMACYIRWIAMVSVGGGFLADYDTFPLNHFLRHGRELPFDGQLTVWSGHVPALVSGNGPEYFRIAKRIGQSMHKHVYLQKAINEQGPSHLHRNHLPWSDMLALSELYKKVSQSMFISRRQVLNGADALQNFNWTKHECQMTHGMRAVHFSHKAIAQGKQAYRGAVHRGTVARLFLNMWHRNCDYTTIPDENV